MTLQELLATVPWESSYAQLQFLEQTESLWCTEDGRKQIQEWVPLLGKPSQFLQRHLWTLEELIQHTEKAKQWEEEHKAELEANREAQRKNIPLTIREAKDKWRAAVQAKNDNVGASKQWTDAEVARLRAAHVALELEWTNYVAKVRNELRQLRGS